MIEPTEPIVQPLGDDGEPPEAGTEPASQAEDRSTDVVLHSADNDEEPPWCIGAIGTG